MAKTQKLNVGLVFDDSLDRPDGVAQYVKTVGAWLSRQGHNVSYLVGETKLTEWNNAPIYSLSKNITVNFNGNRLSMPLPGNRKTIKKLLAKDHFDVLHVMVPYSPFMAAKVINSVPNRTAVVGTFHIFPSGPVSVWGSKLLKIWLARSLKKFSQIVAVSQASADFAKQAYGINAAVIPNPINVDAFKPKTIRKNDPNQIVFLGRLVKRKGAAQLIEAFDELARHNPDARLTIAGDGPQRKELEARVVKLGLEDKVKFLGYIPEDQKSELLGAAAVACFPSLYGEAFGIVLIEAMAAQTPVVLAGDNPGYRSVLGQRPELLINPNDKIRFARQLNELLTNKATRRQISDWQKKAIKQYDINIVGAQIINLCNSAIARLSKKSHN